MNPDGIGHSVQDSLAWLFKVRCGSGEKAIKIRVHEDFTEAEAATVAERFGKAIGRLPKVLRTGIKPAEGLRKLSIHKGHYQWFASRLFGHVRIYTGYMQDGDLEEVLAHEAAHVSLDDRIITGKKPDRAWGQRGMPTGVVSSRPMPNNVPNKKT